MGLQLDLPRRVDGLVPLPVVLEDGVVDHPLVVEVDGDPLADHEDPERVPLAHRAVGLLQRVLRPLLVVEEAARPGRVRLGVPDLHLRRAAEVEAAVSALLDLPVGEELEVAVVARSVQRLSPFPSKARTPSTTVQWARIVSSAAAWALASSCGVIFARFGGSATRPFQPSSERPSKRGTKPPCRRRSRMIRSARSPRGGIGEGGLDAAEDRVRLVAGQPALLGRLPGGEVEEGRRGRVAQARAVEAPREEPQGLGLADAGDPGQHALLVRVVPGQREGLLERGELLRDRQARPGDEARVALDRSAELVPARRRRGEAQQLLGRRGVGPPGEGTDGGGLDRGVRARGLLHGRTERRRPADPRQDLQDLDLPGGRGALQESEEAVPSPLGVGIPEDGRRDRLPEANDRVALGGLLQHRDEAREVGVPREVGEGAERGVADGGVGVLGQSVDALDLAAAPPSRPAPRSGRPSPGEASSRGAARPPARRAVRGSRAAPPSAPRSRRRRPSRGAAAGREGRPGRRGGPRRGWPRGARPRRGCAGSPGRRAAPPRPRAGRAWRRCRRGRRVAPCRPSRSTRRVASLPGILSARLSAEPRKARSGLTRGREKVGQGLRPDGRDDEGEGRGRVLRLPGLTVALEDRAGRLAAPRPSGPTRPGAGRRGGRARVRSLSPGTRRRRATARGRAPRRDRRCWPGRRGPPGAGPRPRCPRTAGSSSPPRGCGPRRGPGRAPGARSGAPCPGPSGSPACCSAPRSREARRSPARPAPRRRGTSRGVGRIPASRRAGPARGRRRRRSCPASGRGSRGGPARRGSARPRPRARMT